MITQQNWTHLADTFARQKYIIIDNFWLPDIANQLSNDFPDYNSNVWNATYQNLIENKRACNAWDRFPATTYEAFYFLCSRKFEQLINQITGFTVYSDIGLHGGGWHCHGPQGFLNLHHDYHIHPKLKLKRQLNIIVYLTKDWNPDWNGALELHSQDKTSIIEKINCMFNRAVIFDTTEPFWHGLPEPLACPSGVSRNSMAAYYLTDPSESDLSGRRRALFTASKHQEGDPEVEELIRKRSDEQLSTLVYRSND